MMKKKLKRKKTIRKKGILKLKRGSLTGIIDRVEDSLNSTQKLIIGLAGICTLLLLLAFVERNRTAQNWIDSFFIILTLLLIIVRMIVKVYGVFVNLTLLALADLMILYVLINVVGQRTIEPSNIISIILAFSIIIFNYREYQAKVFSGEVE